MFAPVVYIWIGLLRAELKIIRPFTFHTKRLTPMVLSLFIECEGHSWRKTSRRMLMFIHHCRLNEMVPVK